MKTKVPYQQITISKIQLQRPQHPDPIQRDLRNFSDFAAVSAQLKEWSTSVSEDWERLDWSITFSDGTVFPGFYNLFQDDCADLVARVLYGLAFEWRARQDAMMPDGL